MGAPHLDFEMWESTNSMKLLHPVGELGAILMEVAVRSAG
jgi:hypothetical protein